MLPKVVAKKVVRVLFLCVLVIKVIFALGSDISNAMELWVL
jgi:hypothetical protein